MINMIAAVSQNGIIGINNKIPWYCKADFQHFKKTTMDNVVVMGRKTYDSLFDHMKDKSGEPLPGRIKYVISSNPNNIQLRPNVFISTLSNSNPSLFVSYLMEKHYNKDIFVTGGTQIYKLFEGYYQNIFLTRIDKNCIFNQEDIVHYLPIKDSVLIRDYELLYTNIVELDPDTQSIVRYEQWRIRNLYGK